MDRRAKRAIDQPLLQPFNRASDNFTCIETPSPHIGDVDAPKRARFDDGLFHHSLMTPNDQETPGDLSSMNSYAEFKRNNVAKVWDSDKMNNYDAKLLEKTQSVANGENLLSVESNASLLNIKSEHASYASWKATINMKIWNNERIEEYDRRIMMLKKTKNIAYPMNSLRTVNWKSSFQRSISKLSGMDTNKIIDIFAYCCDVYKFSSDVPDRIALLSELLNVNSVTIKNTLLQLNPCNVVDLVKEFVANSQTRAELNFHIGISRNVRNEKSRINCHRTTNEIIEEKVKNHGSCDASTYTIRSEDMMKTSNFAWSELLLNRQFKI